MRKKTRRNAEGEVIKPREIRWGFMIMWAVLLGVVIVVVTGILPGGGPVLKLSGRSERRQLLNGEKMEKDSLWLTAADTYQTLVADPKVSAGVKARAAERLSSIYTGKLSDESAAIKALESAFFYTSEPKAKHRLEVRLAGLRATSKARGEESPKTAASAPVPTPRPAPPGSVIARIGDDAVTLEDILYAWSRANPKKQPTGEDLQKHAINYLNQALLAVEARRRNKEQGDGYQLEMRYFERQLLAQSLLSETVPKKSEEEAAGKKYYDEHLDKFQEPGSAVLRHILIKDKEAAEAVGQRLAAGEDFVKLAGEVSVDREQLPDGGVVGRFHEGDDFMPYIGSMPSLMKRLMKLNDGQTTGPIQSARGFHWFRIEEKKGASARPYEQVAERAARDARAELIKKGQEDLLADLKKAIPVEIDEKAMTEGFAKLQARQQKDKPAPQEGPPAPEPTPVQP